jgi:hypothetical protein
MTIPTAINKVVSALSPSSKKIDLPENGHPAPARGQKTPKTPQDEAIAFFSSEAGGTKDEVQVWELWLEDDGGPAANKSVSPVPKLGSQAFPGSDGRNIGVTFMRQTEEDRQGIGLISRLVHSPASTLQALHLTPLR